MSDDVLLLTQVRPRVTLWHGTRCHACHGAAPPPPPPPPRRARVNAYARGKGMQCEQACCRLVRTRRLAIRRCSPLPRHPSRAPAARQHGRPLADHRRRDATSKHSTSRSSMFRWPRGRRGQALAQAVPIFFKQRASGSEVLQRYQLAWPAGCRRARAS